MYGINPQEVNWICSTKWSWAPRNEKKSGCFAGNQGGWTICFSARSPFVAPYGFGTRPAALHRKSHKSYVYYHLILCILFFDRTLLRHCCKLCGQQELCAYPFSLKRLFCLIDRLHVLTFRKATKRFSDFFSGFLLVTIMYRVVIDRSILTSGCGHHSY